MGRRASNIILTGFSATGKSLVGREVALRLSWNFVDTDEEIVKLAGKPITEIFQHEGESRFRELERETIRKACRQRQIIIAIGGGAIVDPRNYETLARAGFIICLEARPETIYDRLFQSSRSSSGSEVRPLLVSDNPLERIKRLKSSRQPYYANVDWTIHTDNLSTDQVAEEVIRAWRLLHGVCPKRYETIRGAYPERDSLVASLPQNDKKRRNQSDKGRRVRSEIKKETCNDGRNTRGDTDEDAACIVETTTQSYPVFVGYGLLDKLVEKIKKAGLSGRVIIISDETVFSIYGNKIKEVLKGNGLSFDNFVVPPGEETKSMDFVLKIYDFLIERRVERDDIIIALGGGVVGDLAGFVAATFLRGISWIQVPTSLVAMVDASIGGKVGVNHSKGKNLIGAFYQPSFVLADCQTLITLPQREFTSGWAEVIKHGLILDKKFLDFLEANHSKLVNLEPAVLTQAIARGATIKAQVVSKDERERGIRTLLNYGHTIAHGLEAATGYKRFLHGEAVAIGMAGAAKLSQMLGLLSSDVVSRQQSLLQKFGLPIMVTDLELSKVTKAMQLDKKIKKKEIHWVLLEDVGTAVIRGDVPEDDVLAMLKSLIKQ